MQAQTPPLPIGSASTEMPIGAVILFAGEDIPRGWLLCDGTAVSAELYPELLLQLGARFGTGSDGTTFCLPDLRGPSPNLRYIIRAMAA